MNKKISEILKRLTIGTLLMIFTFILLAPTADALNYDPKVQKPIIAPDGDGDPWDVEKVNDPPPDDNDLFIIYINDFKVGFTTYLYFKFGWYSHSNWKNIEIDDTPIRNIIITPPDDSENDSKQTNTNR